MNQAPLTVQIKAATVKSGLTFLAEHAYPPANCTLNIVTHNKHLWFLLDDIYGQVGFSVPCILNPVWGRVNLQEAYFFLVKAHKKDTLTVVTDKKEMRIKCSKGILRVPLLDDRFCFDSPVAEIPFKSGYFTLGDCQWFSSQIRSPVFLDISLGTTVWTQLDSSAEIGLDYPVSPFYNQGYFAGYSKAAFQELIDCLSEIEGKKLILFKSSLGVIGSRLRTIHDDPALETRCLLQEVKDTSYTVQFQLPEQISMDLCQVVLQDSVAYLGTKEDSQILQGIAVSPSVHQEWIPNLTTYLSFFSGRNLIISWSDQFILLKSGSRYIAVNRQATNLAEG